VVPGSAGHTPVDLGNYTSWLNGNGAASRLTIARRHGVGVAAPAAGVSLAMTIDPPAGQDGAEPAEGDSGAGLEVPAFMRRVKQA
jgi:hypothetical protein